MEALFSVLIEIRIKNSKQKNFACCIKNIISPQLLSSCVQLRHLNPFQ